jgi:hypothetical protein
VDIMHPTHLATGSRRVGYLDTVLARGMFIDFYDPDGDRYGLPTYPFHWAPDGLLTIRQLRDKGLRPGGQDPVAQILWRRRKRIARRTCPTCGHEKPYYIPRSLGECNDCAAGGYR